MNKSELIVHIRTLQREVDCLMDIVIAMEETQPEQPVQIRQNDDHNVHCKSENVLKFLAFENSVKREYPKSRVLFFVHEINCEVRL